MHERLRPDMPDAFANQRLADDHDVESFDGKIEQLGVVNLGPDARAAVEQSARAS